MIETIFFFFCIFYFSITHYLFKNFSEFRMFLKGKLPQVLYRIRDFFSFFLNFFKKRNTPVYYYRTNTFFFNFSGFLNIFNVDANQIDFFNQFYISLDQYVFLSFSVQVFLFGLVGTAFNKRNFVSLLLSIEIMFLGLGLLFIGFSSLKSTLINFSVPLLILGISACETALGLSILIFMYKFGWQTDNFLFKNLQVKSLNNFYENFGSKNKEISNNNYIKDSSFSDKKISSIFFLQNFFVLFKEVSVESMYYNPVFLMKNFDYIYVIFFWLISFFFMSLLVFVTRILALYKPTRQKLSSYECGFEPFSDSRGKHDVLFYVVAILFILFDVELVFIMPWAANYSFLPTSSYFLVFFFIFTLVVGFAYEWKNGALSWVTK